jgi:hypothetical protein
MEKACTLCARRRYAQTAQSVKLKEPQHFSSWEIVALVTAGFALSGTEFPQK